MTTAEKYHKIIHATMEALKKIGASIDEDTGYDFIVIGGSKEYGFTGAVDVDNPDSGANLLLNMFANEPALVEMAKKALLVQFLRETQGGCGDPDCKSCNPEGNSVDFEEFINQILKSDE